MNLFIITIIIVINTNIIIIVDLIQSGLYKLATNYKQDQLLVTFDFTYFPNSS